MDILKDFVIALLHFSEKKTLKKSDLVLDGHF